MSELFNMQVTQVVAKKYNKSSKKEKGRILAEYCKDTGISKNLASKRFRSAVRDIYPVALKTHRVLKKRGPKVKYKTKHKELIKKLWMLYGNICPERLHPQIVTGLHQLSLSSKLTTYSKEEILLVRSVSLGQLKKIVATFTRPKGYRKNSRKPGIYSKVPIQANFNKYSHKGPGYIELDPVEHNGGNSGGIYAITGCYVDVSCQWLQRHAALGGNQKSVQEIHDNNIRGFIHEIRKYHCDNARALLKVLFKKVTGTEINKIDKLEVDKQKQLLKELESKLTRSRPYKKEDNGHVEQKNGDKVRKLVGYYRYDTKKQVELLNKLYKVEDLMTNYFTPSQKLQEKIYDNMGKPIIKRYDKPTTPYHRLLRSKQISKEIKNKLKATYRTLSLVELREESNIINLKLLKSVRGK